MHRYRLLIDGKLVDGAATMDIVNPATRCALATCPRCDAAQFEAAVAAAKRAFPAWSRTSWKERQTRLNAVADAIVENVETLARILTQEQGKPLAEARMEIEGTAGFFRYFASLERPMNVIEDGDTRRVEEHFRPLGVVAAIVPWNFPVLLTASKLPPALLAGNTVVLKPAPTTPLTTLKLGELFAQTLPAGVVNIVTDQNDLGHVLTGHPDVAKVSFTGSTATGRKVMASIASDLKRVTLELGGNDPAIVLDDADPKSTARGIFQGAFLNCGQVCIALKRVYAHERIYDELCSELAALASNAVVGDGLQPGVQIGPLQNKMQYEKVKEILEDAKLRGKVIAGGDLPDLAGYFVNPTIVRDIDHGARVVDEEQFGPILPVIKFHDEEDAIRKANAFQWGLGASVWSSSTNRAYQVADRIDAGTVWVNTHMDFGPHIPFGGAKQSGIGSELGPSGVIEFTQRQIVNLNKLST